MTHKEFVEIAKACQATVVFSTANIAVFKGKNVITVELAETCTPLEVAYILTRADDLAGGCRGD